MSETDERINSFAPLSKSEWLEKVVADLKGSSPDRLRTRLPGGIDVDPLRRLLYFLVDTVLERPELPTPAVVSIGVSAPIG